MSSLTRVFALLILIRGIASGADLSAVANRAPSVVLDPIYQIYQTMPCQFYGFSHASGGVKDVAGSGVTATAVSHVWTPLKDESAPNGDGFILDSDESTWKSMGEAGMYALVRVGDGVFPNAYYDKYPDFVMIDQDGKPFDRRLGWPMDHPQEIESCSAATTATVKNLRDQRIAMWLLGYAPSMAYADSPNWADYGENSVAHFREFCRMRYVDIAKLNVAWGTDYAAFENVGAPKTPKVSMQWSDWLDYRFRATSERYVWLYQAVLNGGSSRPALAPGISSIFRDLRAAHIGMMPDALASVSDGLAEDEVYCAADLLNSTGKPISLSNGPTNPVLVRRHAYEALGSGMWSVELGGYPAPDEAKKVFGEFEVLEPYLQHMYPVRPKLGVYVSRSTWALEGFGSSLVDLRIGLAERHVPMSFAYDGSAWSRYPMLLSIGNRVISASAAGKLKSYVEAGGVLVIAGRFGDLSDALKPFSKPVLAEKAQVMRVPGLNGMAAKIGKGLVVWLTDDPSMALADRIVRLMGDLDVSVPATLESADGASGSSVEAFTLTDGLNYIQVFVNTSDDAVTSRVSLDPQLLDPKAGYHVRDSISGRYFGRFTGDAISYNLELAPKSTAAVLVMYDASKAEAEKAVAVSDACVLRWRGFDRQYAFTYADAAKSALAAGKYAKAVALASKAVSALGIQGSVKDGNALQITATVLDSAGKPVADADVRAVITPAFGYTVKLSSIGGGKYAAKVERESLGKLYDYKARKYVSFSGPVVVDITARRGHAVGALRVSGAL